VFRHRLALALHKTVDELEISMSRRELRDWETFDTMHEPLPDRLMDIHFSMIASLVVNLMRDADAPLIPVADFFVIKDRAPARVGDEIDTLRAQWRGE
jgi:hypothetical protein